ncbi:hypothetical protein AAG570_011706 [Ranatra chinensis]|uniref:Uncharacterized protein n=1 Tax=Ranatra chinensis TaxID=642074 RepID=A0ABD0YGP6_9HEMI
MPLKMITAWEAKCWNPQFNTTWSTPEDSALVIVDLSCKVEKRAVYSVQREAPQGGAGVVTEQPKNNTNQEESDEEGGAGGDVTVTTEPTATTGPPVGGVPVYAMPPPASSAPSANATESTSLRTSDQVTYTTGMTQSGSPYHIPGKATSEMAASAK